MRHLYLANRFFLSYALVALLFVLGYVWPLFYPLALTAFLLLTAAVAADLFLLFQKNVRVKVRRRLPKIMSLGDDNPVQLQVRNLAGRPLRLVIIDELPFQFQKRDFAEKITLQAGEEQTLQYTLTPVSRGEYAFGVTNVFAETTLGLVQRRFRLGQPMALPVYPSVLQMKQYEMLAFNRLNWTEGLRKIRRIGHSYEFEQIKDYVRGDDYRSINWKATGRQGKLMVNQYEDERSQQVYCLIDKSRAMRMPFAGMSLMDYAINTSLALSNIALKKHDKAGLITFSDKIGATIKAGRKGGQLNKILHALYNEAPRPLEANYELLYHIARKLINGRSLLLLYTNFASMYALDRVLPVLRRINKFHLLVVIFFENTEVEKVAFGKAANMEDIYTQTIAQKFLAEKKAMADKLQKHGIQTILTPPAELSMHTVNKYLELKSRGLI